MTLDIDGNTFTNPRLSAFTAFISNQTLAAASMVGKIRNNTIGASGMIFPAPGKAVACSSRPPERQP